MYFSSGKIIWISDIVLENFTRFVAAFKYRIDVCMETSKPVEQWMLCEQVSAGNRYAAEKFT